MRNDLLQLARRQCLRFAAHERPRPRSREFEARFDLSGLEALDEFYGEGSARHADLLLERAIRAHCTDAVRLLQDGPLSYVVAFPADCPDEAECFVTRVQATFANLLFDAGYECDLDGAE
jgi:hypothetical protein